MLATPSIPSPIAVASAVLRHANSERKKRMLGELRELPGLGLVASAHSRAMAEREFFGHADPDGLGPGDRVARQLPQLVGSIAENLAQLPGASGWPAASLARTTVSEWMASPGHRDNLLNPSFDHAGVGVHLSAQGVRVTLLLSELMALLDLAPPIAVARGQRIHLGITLGRSLTEARSISVLLVPMSGTSGPDRPLLLPVRRREDRLMVEIGGTVVRGHHELRARASDLRFWRLGEVEVR